MATYTLTVNEKTKAGKDLIALLSSLTDVVLEPAIDISGINEALKDVETGKVYTAKNGSDLISKCLS